MKALQIFKPGKHTASDGRVLTFSEAQLKACAAAYDPAVYEAPLVIGHISELGSDAPAYGWAKKISFAEGTLNVEPDQVDAQFAELVNAGRFKKISASFWMPDTPGNPKPGTLYPHHIAFLGAKAPAVKGLKSASFAEKPEGLVEFMDWSQRDIATLFRNLREWIIGKDGQEAADKVIPSYAVDSIQEDAVKTPSPSISSYTEPNLETKEQMEARLRAEVETKVRGELKTETDRLASQRTEFAESQKAEQRKKLQREAAEFVDAQVKEGKVLPAQRDGLVAFMAALPVDGIVEFGEGDKAVKKPNQEFLREYIKGLPKLVDFTERAGGELPKDMTAQQVAAKAVEFQESERKAGREITITAAVTHVTNQAAK